MLLETLFLYWQDFSLDRSGKVAGILRAFLIAPLFRSEKTAVLSHMVTADRQLVFVKPHLSVALSRRWKPDVGPRKNTGRGNLEVLTTNEKTCWHFSSLCEPGLAGRTSVCTNTGAGWVH